MRKPWSMDWSALFFMMWFGWPPQKFHRMPSNRPKKWGKYGQNSRPCPFRHCACVYMQNEHKRGKRRWKGHINFVWGTAAEFYCPRGRLPRTDSRAIPVPAYLEIGGAGFYGLNWGGGKRVNAGWYWDCAAWSLCVRRSRKPKCDGIGRSDLEIRGRKKLDFWLFLNAFTFLKLMEKGGKFRRNE